MLQEDGGFVFDVDWGICCMMWFILFYFVLCCFILFCFVLFCFVLCCFVLFCFMVAVCLDWRCLLIINLMTLRGISLLPMNFAKLA